MSVISSNSWSPFVRLVHDFPIPTTLRELTSPRIGDHALHFFASGSGWSEAGGVRTAIEPGMLFLVRPGEGYSMHFAPGSDVRMLNIRFDLEDSPAFHCPHPAPPEDWERKLVLPAGDIFPGSLMLRNPEIYTGLFFRLLRIWESDHVSSVLAGKGLLLEILGLLAEQSHLPPTGHGTFSRARLYDILSGHLRRGGQLPTPEALAAEAGMSRSAFYRHFRRLTGKSIHQYFLEQRLLNAQMELLHTSDPIKIIAARHGFSSVHHFTRVFCRANGVSPGEFRRKFTGK
jgi:AraC-like DNA-binding protein